MPDNARYTTQDIIQTNQNKETFTKRIIEALLFSASSPLSIDEIYRYLPQDLHIDVYKILRLIQADYDGRGIEIIEINKKWSIRTALDLTEYLTRDIIEHKKLSKSSLETLGIVAYHQPVTRTEIESIRGVSISKTTLDQLMAMNWIKLGRRRETPGRPITFMTTEYFLEHFGLKSIKDLPGLRELKEAGFLDSTGRQITDDEMKSMLDLEQDQDNSQESMTFTFDDAIKDL